MYALNGYSECTMNIGKQSYFVDMELVVVKIYENLLLAV